MAKIISLFNHKGGVSKTTTTYHLSWMLTNLGQKVIMVDMDAQCNLTGLVLGEERFEEFYEEQPQNNIKSAVEPAFLGNPVPIQEIDGIEVKENLWLIPGHIDITEFDISLGMAHNFSSSMSVLTNLPGAFYDFLTKMANKVNADYIIIDMNPSLSEINKNLLMISDFFIVPTSPDYFSQMALKTLSTILPKWKQWSLRAKDYFKTSVYPFPDKNPKLLGIVMQNYSIRNGKPASAFQQKIDKVLNTVCEVLVPVLSTHDLVMKSTEVEGKNFCLTYIPNFQSLVARMQEEAAPSTPVYAIDAKYLGVGTVLGNYIAKQQELYEIFEVFAKLVMELTKDEADRAV